MNKRFRVAILGCGPGGSYLYRLLQLVKPEIEVTIFDKPQRAACGIKPCAWGVAWKNFAALCRLAGREPDKYVIGKYRHVIAAGLKVKGDIAIINKSSFIEDLLSGTTPLDPAAANLTAFDRIVDATGVRDYLPVPLSGAFVNTVQVKVKVDSVTCPVVSPHKDGGYSWLFPVGNAEAHLGALSATGIDLAAKQITALKQDFKTGEILCSCRARIWRGGPVPPFVEGNVWGLGESIGLVDPIPGAGIVSAMDSARIMVDNWDDAVGYRNHIWHEYGYMVKEARLVQKLAGGQRPSIFDFMLPRRAFYNVGVEPTLRQIFFAARETRNR